MLGPQTKPRVETIRAMITSDAQLLASLNAASISSRKMNNYTTVLGFTCNSWGAFALYNYIYITYINVNYLISINLQIIVE